MQSKKLFFVGKYKIKGVKNYASLNNCMKYIESKKVLGLDIETTKKYSDHAYSEINYKGGLDPYLSNIVMLQIGDLEEAYVIDVRDFSRRELQPIIDFLDYNDEVTFVGANLKFEGKHLKHKFGIRLKKIWDVMICDMILTNGLGYRYSLAHMSNRYLGIEEKKENSLFSDDEYSKKVTMDDYMLMENENLLTPFEIADDYYIDKSTRMQFVRIGKKHFSAEQVNYGSDDIVLPLLIRERQILGRKLPSGEIYNPKRCFRLENSFTQVLADIELQGMDFDKQYWLNIADKNEAIHAERTRILEEYVIKEYPKYMGQYNLFSGRIDCTIEWSSPKQVVDFFKSLEICPREWSSSKKAVAYTVGATALTKKLPKKHKIAYMKDKWPEKIENTDDMILAFLLVSKANQAITTFGRDFLKYVHPITGKIHTSFRQILNTGRMSSSRPNMQNISSGDFRNAFRVKKGRMMLNNDYSSQESRVLADLCGDKSFVDFFTNGDPFFGQDFHAYTAQKVFRLKEDNPELIVNPKDLPTGGSNPDFNKDDNERRADAKTVNFGFAYGKSAKGFSEDFGISIEETEAFLESYLEAFPGLRSFFEKQKKFVVDNGFIIIDKYTDRRWFSTDHDKMGAASKEAMSYFPDDYKRMLPEERKKFKAELYEEYPHIKDLWRTWGRIKGSLERKGLNYPIQGLASSQIKMALCALRHFTIINELDQFLPINIVHDEVLADVPEDDAEDYGKVLSHYMMWGANELMTNKFMKADTVISPVWTH